MAPRLLALAAAVCSLASSAATPPRPPVVVLLPVAGPAELRPLALLVAARASELMEASAAPGVVEVDLQQALRALEEEALPAGAGQVERLKALVGADRALAFEVSGGPALALTLRLSTAAGTEARTVPLGQGWGAALEAGAAAVAGALLGRPPPAAPAQPASRSDGALQALGRCWGAALRQPLAVETPALLDAQELDAARADCRQALALDPSLRFAAAVLALVEAIAGDDAAAVQRLQALTPGDEVLEPATLARFWLLTRYQSNAAGVAYLREVVRRHPLELLPRASLGETLLLEGEFAEAEATWREYARLAPASGWALGRLSKALARLGRHEQAVAVAREGLALAGSRDARLELGGRLIDAGQAAAAVEVLRPLATLARPRGEHLVRLGWATWLTGDVDAAAAAFQRALALATSPAEWRTRGRAHYDLALVEARRGHPQAARQALQASLRTGYRPRTVDAALAGLLAELEDPGHDAGVPRPTLLPRESSLFPLDAFGEPDPRAPKPPPPEGFVLFHF